MNLCRECRWVKGNVRRMKCDRPSEETRPLDPVTGATILPTCASERASEELCGQKGRYYEGKE